MALRFMWTVTICRKPGFEQRMSQPGRGPASCTFCLTLRTHRTASRSGIQGTDGGIPRFRPFRRHADCGGHAAWRDKRLETRRAVVECQIQPAEPAQVVQRKADLPDLVSGRLTPRRCVHPLRS